MGRLACVFVLGLTLWCGLPSNSSAGSPLFGIHGGGSFPTGELRESLGRGYHAGIEIPLVRDAYGILGVEANYHGLGERTRRALGIFDVTQDVEILEGLAYVQLPLLPRAVATPYFKAGLTVNRVATEVTLVSPFGSSGRIREVNVWPGYVAGLGLSVPPFAVEATFHSIAATSGGLANQFAVAMAFRPLPSPRP
jgi:hypothetical protein